MSIITASKMTAGQFLNLDEDASGVRRELDDGDIVVSPSPIPRHGFAMLRLARILGAYIDDNELGELHHDTDTFLDKLNVRRPDLLYFSCDRVFLIGETNIQGPPDLAVEVLSPGSLTTVRKTKFRQYQNADVMHYWIVDPEQRTLEAWSLQAKKYVTSGRGNDSDTLKLAPFPELSIPLDRLWRK